jgi:membrane protease YdiL (CAAX protease family)
MQGKNRMVKDRFLLYAEFFLICLLVPGLIIGFRLAPFMFAFLWGATLYGGLVTYFSVNGKTFLRQMWRFEEIHAKNLRLVILRWIFACVMMTVLIYMTDPGRAFGLFDRMPLWAVPLLIFGYTLLSALPQEFMFCAYFFRRYASLFPGGWGIVMVSAVVFAFAHVLFLNWIAPPLSLIAGIIFAHTYYRTRSLALVTLEHGLYGGYLFIVGLGWYFYHGSVTMG